MKRYLLFGIAAVAGLSLLSCERKEMAVSDDAARSSVPQYYYASIESTQDAPAAKAYVDENYKVLWHADDRISVFNNYTFNRQYRFTGETGVNYGRFEVIPDEDYVTGNELDHIYAIYPYKESNYVTNDEVMQAELPAVQPYAEKSFAPGINTMVSVTDTQELIFKNACGYLGVKLYGGGVGISSIVLEGNDGELITGKANITMVPGGVPSLALIDKQDDSQQQISLTCEPAVQLGASAQEYTEFWFVVPPMTFAHGITVHITGSDGGTIDHSTSDAITVERSKITHLAPISAEELLSANYTPEITIDGKFTDWEALNPRYVYTAQNNPDSPWTAVEEMRVCVTSDYVYYYIRFNADEFKEIQANSGETLPMRINLNTDGEFTSGYSGYFVEKYDFMLEGSLLSGGNFRSFNGTFYQRIGSWSNLGSGITSGAGSRNEYEIALNRQKFNEIANTTSAPMPMGDEFQTGLRFYTTWTGSWVELSNLPNASTDENTSGYGHLLTVSTKPHDVNTEPTPESELAPEIKDGDSVLACNADVQKFLTDVTYPTHDYTSTSLLTWAEQNSVAVSPGNSDRAPVYTIRWDKGVGNVRLTLTETYAGEQRSRVYDVTGDYYYQDIYNLLPNASYHFEVRSITNELLKQGDFVTYGKVHQLYLRSMIRNCRDLGGWTTQDGKTVKYRKVYRGGRLELAYLNKAGKRDLVAEGIKAQLDLRGHSDVLSTSTLDGIVDDYAFCAPVIEEGYSQMLSSDKEKTRQCMQFIIDCVDAGKPVYFHCSLGRDRTGTVAMLTLGILGVPEGDISKEYELTQFAPQGYSVSTGEKTKMTRIVDYKGAANYIWNNYVSPGETFRDGVEKYFLEIGISQADIDKFRSNMLQ